MNTFCQSTEQEVNCTRSRHQSSAFPEIGWHSEKKVPQTLRMEAGRRVPRCTLPRKRCSVPLDVIMTTCSSIWPYFSYCICKAVMQALKTRWPARCRLYLHHFRRTIVCPMQGQELTSISSFKNIRRRSPSFETGSSDLKTVGLEVSPTGYLLNKPVPVVRHREEAAILQ
jgi:hypothetical protein